MGVLTPLAEVNTMRREKTFRAAKPLRKENFVLGLVTEHCPAQLGIAINRRMQDANDRGGRKCG